jgi:hypothetical protein
MKTRWILLGLFTSALGLSTLIEMGPTWLGQAPAAPDQTEGKLPWQVKVHADGSSTVMGITLGTPAQSSPLSAVQGRWGQDTQVAIVAAPNEDGTLEAFVDPAQAGFVTGKFIVTAALPPDVIRAMKARAIKAEFMESTTRKYRLSAEDMAVAMAAPVVALSFIPQANLDADTVVARFGQPSERVRQSATLTHFLYPQLGLDLALSTDGKELLQYVAPAQFERLRAPLKASQAAASTSTASSAVSP